MSTNTKLARSKYAVTFGHFWSVVFGLIFSFIGFVNTFWGNDPFYGLAMVVLSFFYYLPIIDLLRESVKPNFLTVTKYIIGFLILWSSLGVGELFCKVELMINGGPDLCE